MHAVALYLRPDPPAAACSACRETTIYRDRETGARLCLECLGQWAGLRRMGWTGRPGDMAAVEWLALPAPLVRAGGNSLLTSGARGGTMAPSPESTGCQDANGGQRMTAADPRGTRGSRLPDAV